MHYAIYMTIECIYQYIKSTIVHLDESDKHRFKQTPELME